MDFKWTLALGLMLVSATFLSGCGDQPRRGMGEDYIIGQKVRDMSSLNMDADRSARKIAVYDKTVQLIHLFDLGRGELDRSFVPRVPSGEHGILYSPEGRYVIDLFESYVGVYNRQGVLNSTAVQLAGKVVGAAFQAELGLLVVQDDQRNVGVLRLGANGEVERAFVGGDVLDSTGSRSPSITAGDLDETGRLIVAMSDDSISIVDLDQSDERRWVSTNFFPSVALKRIRWLAPVRGEPDQILVRSEGRISLIDLSTHAELAFELFDEAKVVVNTSKVRDAHVILVKQRVAKLVFAQHSLLEARDKVLDEGLLLSSVLNLDIGRWTYLDSTARNVDYRRSAGWEMNSPNGFKQSRQIHRQSLSGRSFRPLRVANEPEVEMTSSSLFQLFPSKLGYATYTDLETGEIKKITMFNRDGLR